MLARVRTICRRCGATKTAHGWATLPKWRCRIHDGGGCRCRPIHRYVLCPGCGLVPVMAKKPVDVSGDPFAAIKYDYDPLARVLEVRGER